MKLLVKVLIIFPVLFLLFFITSSKVHAADETFSLDPPVGSIDETTPTVTITFISPNFKVGTSYGVCMNHCSPDNAIDSETSVQVTPQGNGKLVVTVCGVQKHLTTTCNDGNGFLANQPYYTYIAEGYMAPDKNGNLQNQFPLLSKQGAVSFTPTFFKPTILTQPTDLKPTDPMIIGLSGRRRPISDLSRNTYYLELNKKSSDPNSSAVNFVSYFCEIPVISGSPFVAKPAGDPYASSYDFGIHGEGHYILTVYESKNGSSGPCQSNNTVVETKNIDISASGTIISDGGPKLVTPDPKTPITSKFKTLPALVISGLTPTWWYTIELSGQWVDHTLNMYQGTNRFQADATGTLTITNICDNGEAGRDSSNNPCGDDFRNGSYGIIVKELNGKIVLQDAFGVNVVLTISYGDVGLAPVTSCDTSSKECKTGLGILSSDPAKFVNQVVGIAIGIAAGVAFLLFVYGGFRLAFSQGDPKAVQEGREVITSAIIGFLIIVFSVFLLKLIGIDILGLPI